MEVHIWCQMARRPNHRLSDAERFKGQIASRASASQNSSVRRTGWLIDAAGFILGWRREGNEGDPPISKLRRFLTERGWTSERGKQLSRTEVDRMLEDIDPTTSGIPRNEDEWKDFKDGNVVISNGEIMTTAIDPAGWQAFQQAQKDGWKPTWRGRTLNGTDEEAEAERLRELLARPPLERPHPNE